jgi:hypothetical protein
VVSRNIIGKEVSPLNHSECGGEPEVDEDGFEVADDTPELRATVEMGIQGKVDANHPEGGVAQREYEHKQDRDEEFAHLTLEQEERIRGREEELERISAKAEFGIQDGREVRTRTISAKLCGRAQDERCSEVDPREGLPQEELAQMNKHAVRIDNRLGNGPSRAVIGKRLAKRVGAGQAITEAVFDTIEAIQAEPGVVQSIAAVDQWAYEATIEGEVAVLFEPASNTQQQVGYIEDESGQIKVTIWEKSQQSTVLSEGDRVRIVGGKPGTYRGESTLAVTHDTELVILEEGAGPSPIHWRLYRVGWENSTNADGSSQSPKPVRAGASRSSVTRPEAARFHGTESWIFPPRGVPRVVAGERERSSA